ncbi:MAG: hypothetical protein FWF69_02900 [Firmicutes bacterium]|nr:hypothetical protein [Bacillota bacterium]
MSILGGVKDRVKRVKGAEWAILLIVLGLAGSLLLTPGAELLGGGSGSPKAADSAAAGTLEDRLGRVLSSMEGAGRVEVVIYYSQPAVHTGSWLDSPGQAQAEGEPIGVVVVAEGAGNLQVRLELARAVQTLLRLDADAVEIFKMESP